jgi:hypothetical protein
MMDRPHWRETLADVLGLLAILFVLLDYLRPAVLFLPTITAGGDTPCHYPTAVWFYEHLLPKLRLHGWYPGAYLGHPLLLYYFPLPFLVMAALAPVTGMPIAFKLGTVIGVFLLPLFTYLSFRLMRFRFPAPLLGAASALVFLFLEENPIWGGTIASTLTGEFSYTYGIAFAVLFLGLTYRTFADGKPPWIPALLLAVTALAHGYAVLWAGLSVCYFLYFARKPWRTLFWLVGVGALAFALAGLTLVPLLADWKWTTPYDDPWIDVTTRGLFPALLGPLFAAAALGLLGTLLFARRTGGPDHRLLFLVHAGLVGAALAAAGPALGVIDVRFVPFAQLALCLAGGATMGLAFRRLAAPDLAALAVVLLAILQGDWNSRVIRYWIDWNYSGLESKELWPAFRELSDRLQGTVADPRVAVEYNAIHERAGSIRMYETIPYFSGRSTLEGVYNQASLQTHPVYYLASELGASSPNPFRSRTYSRFDLANAIPRLRLFDVSDVVALSDRLKAGLAARPDARLEAEIPPYSLYHLTGKTPAYVEPMAFIPVRSAWAGWRDKAYRWFSRKPLLPVHLVFTDDPKFGLVEKDEYLPPPQVPLPAGAEVKAVVEDERITITTNRPGHPLLVKVSYHPRWRADGADGPYLVSPALMMVVPRETTVRLVYAGRAWSDWLGLALSAGTLAFIVIVGVSSRRRRGVPQAEEPVVVLMPCESTPPPGRRWGGLVPGLLLLTLALVRLRSDPSVKRHQKELDALYDKASLAYTDERFGDAAEYARFAVLAGPDSPLKYELLCLRGESLLRAGKPLESAEAFEEVLQGPPTGPHVPQALFSAAEARDAAGDKAAADAHRKRLLEQFARTPWAERLRETATAPAGVPASPGPKAKR